MKLADELSLSQKKLSCLIERFRAAEPDGTMMLAYAKAIGVVVEEMQTEITDNTIPTCEALVNSHVNHLLEQDLTELLTRPETTIFKG